MHIETRMAQLETAVNPSRSATLHDNLEQEFVPNGLQSAQQVQELGLAYGFRRDLDDDGSDVEDLDDAQLPILVVDDDLAMRDALKDVLEQLGYGVVGASHGEEALELLRQGCAPSLVLLDLGMPTMDGRQFRKELLRDPRFAGLPVVVITASHDLRAEELSVSEILTKPVQLARLVEILESHTGAPEFQ